MIARLLAAVFRRRSRIAALEEALDFALLRIDVLAEESKANKAATGLVSLTCQLRHP